MVGKLYFVQHTGTHATSVDFEPRYPLPHPLDKINKILFADKERLAERAFSIIAPSPPSQAESALSSRQSRGTFSHLEPHFAYF